jgi:hypothetical protein
LQTHNATLAFINFIPDGIPFGLRIKTPDIPDLDPLNLGNVATVPKFGPLSSVRSRFGRPDQCYSAMEHDSEFATV